MRALGKPGPDNAHASPPTGLRRATTDRGRPLRRTKAALAVEDLQRAGGFQRKNLVVVTTTGSGWVDPALVDSFEYLSGGDCATVAIQYSYLPSWISYLVDQSKALAAGRELSTRSPHGVEVPAAHRPAFHRRGKPGRSARGGLHRRERPGQPHLGRIVAWTANFNPLFRDSATTVTPAARRSSPSTKTDGLCGPRRPTTASRRRPPPERQPDPLCCTRPTRSSGGARI